MFQLAGLHFRSSSALIRPIASDGGRIGGIGWIKGGNEAGKKMDWLSILQPALQARGRRSPMYLRIKQCIEAQITSGALPHDQRLPADRELARLLKIDRSTVARAYDQLESEGLVESHVGRGTFVRSNARNEVVPSYADTAGGALTHWADKFSQSSHNVAAIVGRQPVLNPDAQTISFAAGSPNDEFFPSREFQQIVTDLLSSRDAADMFGYSQPEGHPALRQQVLRCLKEQGIEAADDQLLILSGSQQGIDLVARTLIDPHDALLTEDPTYFWAICTFASYGARCLPVSTDFDGIKLDVLESVASRANAKLLYCMPSFQNPTGSTLSLDRRKRLLALAQKYQLPVLEDNFVGDLHYEENPLPSLCSIDKEASTVIYQGTFSKALCPGLRLGWLVAPRAVSSRLRLAKRMCDLSTNSMAQIILANYLEKGLYDQHLQTVRQAYRQRLDVMCEALSQHAAQWLTWQRPAGGMFIWAKLPPGYSARELLPYAQRAGVLYNPGDVFYVASASPEYIRLNFIQQSSDAIDEGIRRLARALADYSASRRQKGRTADGALVVAESTFI
jgi:DNA-binding transcriptional MocR family regulator